jgi:hypothetical protein
MFSFEKSGAPARETALQYVHFRLHTAFIASSPGLSSPHGVSALFFLLILPGGFSYVMVPAPRGGASKSALASFFKFIVRYSHVFEVLMRFVRPAIDEFTFPPAEGQ